MSGHSHWSGIKHKKAVQDAKRAQIFTKLGRAITVATRLGGDNPDFNPNLRLAIDKAKELNMPKDKIENSIRKGTGEGSENNLIEAEYEALGPFSTMFIVLVITDNKNRTVSELRRMFEKHGGKMANGGVSWNFKRLGYTKIFPIASQKEGLVTLAIENEADNVVEKRDGSIMITSSLTNFNRMKEQLSHYKIIESGVGFFPLNPIALTEKQKEKYDKLIDELAEHPDVQDMFDNVSE